MKKLKITEHEIEPKTLTIEQAKARYNLGTTTLNKIGNDAGAVVYVGRRKIFLIAKLDQYIESLAI